MELSAVVLAAGLGTRLKSRPHHLPKGLVPVLGRPLIDYTLDALRACGVSRVVVVLGHGKVHLQEHMLNGGGHGLRVHLTENRHFMSGSSTSLACARAFTGADPFLLTMADHLLTAGLIGRLLDSPFRRTAVAVDSSPYAAEYAAESTKVAVDAQGFVTDIGKDLPHWDALDTGAFLCTPEVWEALDGVPHGSELNAVFRRLAGRGALEARDVTGSFWYDVDTDADLLEAEARLRGAAGGRAIARPWL